MRPRLVANPPPGKPSRRPAGRPASVTTASSRMSVSLVAARRRTSLRRVGEAERVHLAPRPERARSCGHRSRRRSPAGARGASKASIGTSSTSGSSRLARRPAPRRRTAPGSVVAAGVQARKRQRLPRRLDHRHRRPGSRARSAPASPAAGRSRCGSAGSRRPSARRAGARSPRAHARPPAAPRRRPPHAPRPARAAPPRGRPPSRRGSLTRPVQERRRARRDRGGVQSLRAWLTRWAPDAIGQDQSQSQLPQECLRPLGFGPLTGRPEPASDECSAPAARFEALRHPAGHRSSAGEPATEVRAGVCVD